MKNLPPAKLAEAAGYIYRLVSPESNGSRPALERAFGCLTPSEAEERERAIAANCERIDASQRASQKFFEVVTADVRRKFSQNRKSLPRYLSGSKLKTVLTEQVAVDPSPPRRCARAKLDRGGKTSPPLKLLPVAFDPGETEAIVLALSLSKIRVFSAS